MDDSELPPSGRGSTRRPERGSISLHAHRSASPCAQRSWTPRPSASRAPRAARPATSPAAPSPRSSSKTSARTGLETLKEQTQAKAGVFGTNRVKGDTAGPGPRPTHRRFPAQRQGPAARHSHCDPAHRRAEIRRAGIAEAAVAGAGVRGRAHAERGLAPEPPVLPTGAGATAGRPAHRHHAARLERIRETDSQRPKPRIGCPAA